jgi:hypothetical protein
MIIAITEEQYERIFERTDGFLLEQSFLDKAKAKIQNLKTGVQDIKTNIANKLQPNQQQPVQQTTQQISPVLKEYNDFVDKWKGVNDDLKSNRVFLEQNDHGHGNSMNFQMEMQTDAMRIYAQKLLKLNPNIKTMYNNFYPPQEIDKNCYMKPDQNGNTVTYCAGVYELNLKK